MTNVEGRIEEQEKRTAMGMLGGEEYRSRLRAYGDEGYQGELSISP
jgi:hypothetical protein